VNSIIPNRIESEIPETTISAMVGTYLKISFLTPVLEVKVVHPVKLRAKYAIKAGIIRSKTIGIKTFSQKGIVEFVAKKNAKGIAAIPPKINPFVLKSCVGINGSRTGKNTVPARAVVIAARAAREPARK
jgi:hypothetical protein